MDCSICLENVDKSLVKCRKCVTVYHKECIYKWFETSNLNKCIVCQTPIMLSIKANPITRIFKIYFWEFVAIFSVFVIYAFITNLWKMVIYFILKDFDHFQNENNALYYLLMDFTFQIVIVSRILSYFLIYWVIYYENHIENEFRDGNNYTFNVWNYLNSEVLVVSIQLVLSGFYICEKVITYFINLIF
jgi:hypothetical protein